MTFLLSLLLFQWGTPDVHELQVQVKNISTLQGTVRICLTNRKADFLKSCYRSQEVSAGGKEVTAIFKNIPKGLYAVAVYHDEDDNGEMNKGAMFGIPTEAYGFSNNPPSFFGPPGFEKCTFRVDADTTIVIKL